MQTLAQARATAGINWLDTNPNVRADWRERIDIDTLDLGSVVYCVLGQLYGGSYNAGQSALNVGAEDCENLGLNCRNVDRWELNDAWKKQIVATRKVAPVLREEITLSAADIKLLAQRMKQIQDPEHSLWSTELVIQGVLIKLG